MTGRLSAPGRGQERMQRVYSADCQGSTQSLTRLTPPDVTNGTERTASLEGKTWNFVNIVTVFFGGGSSDRSNPPPPLGYGPVASW